MDIRIKQIKGDNDAIMSTIKKILTPISIIISVLILTIVSANGISLAESNVPIDKISISEEAQRTIWDLCEKNNLSYEFVLAIYHVEGMDNPTIETVKADINKLTNIRDYWANRGVGDEIVFDLTLISWQRGIEGCKSFMNNKTIGALEADDFVQKVTAYKYYLEQRLDKSAAF